MTSPPFPLNTKMAYGNRTQGEYVSCFADVALLLRNMVTETTQTRQEMRRREGQESQRELTQSGHAAASALSISRLM